MLWIDLRQYHGDIGGPSVGAVVGDDGYLMLCIVLLDLLDLLFGHRNGTEHEVDLAADVVDVGDILDYHAFYVLWEGSLDAPASA